MSKSEDLITNLTTQVARLAFAVEAIAKAHNAPSQSPAVQVLWVSFD